jgi:hypothetical protein
MTTISGQTGHSLNTSPASAACAVTGQAAFKKRKNAFNKNV